MSLASHILTYVKLVFLLSLCWATAGDARTNYTLGALSGAAPPVTPSDIDTCVVSHTFPITQPTTVSCSGFGTPKAALVVTDYVNAGSTTTSVRVGIGVTDGTNQYAANVIDADNDAASPTDAYSLQQTDETAVFTTASTVDGEYDVDATGSAPFVTDGVVFESGDMLGATRNAQVLLLGGADLTAVVGTFTASSTIGGTVNVSTGSITASFVLLVSVRRSAIGTVAAPMQICLGAAANRSPIQQGSVGWWQADDTLPTTMGAIVEDRYACAHTTGTAAQQAVEVTAFSANQFTVTSRVEAVASIVYGFLALDLGNLTPFVQVLTPPTTVSAPAVTVTGVTPRFAFLFGSLAQAVRTVEADADANALGVGMTNGSTSGAVSATAEDAQTTTDSQTAFSTNAVRLDSVVGTNSHIATCSSCFSANTITLNWTATDATARKFILAGWGE